MLLLSALWLAVVQALASSAVPAGGPSRAASVAVTASATPTATDVARRDGADGAGAWTRLHGHGELRASEPQQLTPVERTCGRGAPPLRSSAGLARFGFADLALASACVAPPAHRESPAAGSRDGHLTYYPTPPPLER